MFTGIIHNIGTIKEKTDDWKITIENHNVAKSLIVGSSVSTSGVCLTAIQVSENTFKLQISQETLNKTNLRQLQIGQKVNLETSLKIGDTLDGHFVSGHIDTTTEIVDITMIEESYKIKITNNASIKDFIATKGSITLDGISLTINEVTQDFFYVNIIPYTWDNTTLKHSKKGTLLNTEVDILARYIINKNK